ncbi:hypothetical protein ACRRTK_014019 [Alexandromys fortis]
MSGDAAAEQVRSGSGGASCRPLSRALYLRTPPPQPGSREQELWRAGSTRGVPQSWLLRGVHINKHLTQTIA